MINDSTYDLRNAALARFGEFSAAEEKVLSAVQRGELAHCDPNDKDDSPEKDPANSAEWGEDRRVRAELIRWLCTDKDARERVDPRGIQVWAATIGHPSGDQQLDLSAIDIPFRLCFRQCKFEVTPCLVDARISELSLDGSRVPALIADRLRTAGDLALNNRFHVDGEIRLVGADIGGSLVCDSGAEFADTSEVNLEGATVRRAFIWRHLVRDTAVHLNLDQARAAMIADDEKSWPGKGNLRLDGFVYEKIGAGPIDASKRLQWLARQPEGFVPQPYTQLAKVLRAAGNDRGAREVLIAREDARMMHGDTGRVRRALGWILRATVGYGYKPYRALGWFIALVLMGTVLFSWAEKAGILQPIEKRMSSQYAFDPFIYSLENALPLIDLHLAKRWLPNPDAKPIALALPGTDSPIETPAWLVTWLRWYLWLHILLGWFFISMFIAGVSGIIRRE